VKVPPAVLALLLLAGLACNQGSLPDPLSRCLGVPPEPFWVEPVPAATSDEEVTIAVYVGNGERVTVVTDTGAWVASGRFDVDRPAYVRVRLVPDTTHRLVVSARVAASTGPSGCHKGGYTLTTTEDKNGVLLAVVQLDSK
jgi:hypothetical protein